MKLTFGIKNAPSNGFWFPAWMTQTHGWYQIPDVISVNQKVTFDVDSTTGYFGVYVYDANHIYYQYVVNPVVTLIPDVIYYYNCQTKALEVGSPVFEGGVSKTAKAILTNPTAKEFTFSVELYLGVAKTATSGVGSVTIPAGGSLEVNFTLVMPLAEGSYPVFLDAIYDKTLLAHYQATENVAIIISPLVAVGPIIWE